MNKSILSQILALGASFLFASVSSAAPIRFTVNATADIYNTTPPATYPGDAAVDFVVAPNTTGFRIAIDPFDSVSFNGHANNNDADGVGAAPGSSSNTGSTTLSGITALHAGYLVGVFTGAGMLPKPASLDYTVTGTAFTSYAPLLQQVFFIGDGLTGDGVGAGQDFYVPTGATALYLGFADAAGYNGAPGAYDDNSGSLSGFVIFATDINPGRRVPEPEELALLGLGALVAGLIRRRR